MAQQRPTTLSGVVRDADGRALDGASIEVLGTRFKAITGESGTYRFDQVSPGRFWILARRIGYAPVRVSTTLGTGESRSVSFELERLPVRLSEVTVLAEGGMSKYRYQDFVFRSRSAFGKFLTRDDLAQAGGGDLIAVVQRYMPGKSRFALEQRVGGELFGSGRLFRRGTYGSLLTGGALSSLSLDCPPAISVNGATPWPGISLADFDLAQVEALEIYRRGTWVPTEFAYRESSGCGLVVVWLR